MFKAISRNAFLLAIVSFFNDIAGETVRRLFPLFLANVLGVKTAIIGLVEGVSQAVPYLVGPLSGYVSDQSGKRKILIVLGQLFRSVMVFLLFVTTWPQALLVRFLDRLGKGITDGPRDALVADSTKKANEGLAFGLGRTMDNLGATIGILIVLLILFFQGNSVFLKLDFFRLVLTFVVGPALFIALLLVIFGIKEIKTKRESYFFHDHFKSDFYLFLFFNFLFSLGNFSDGFLVLKAQKTGLSLLEILVLLISCNFASALVALPIGGYADHHQKRKILGFGWLLLAASYLGFAQANSFWQLLPLFGVYGLFYGTHQAVAKAMIYDLVPTSREALAFSLYNLVVGLALLPASLLAGLLWQNFHPSAPFYVGSTLIILATYGLFYHLPQPKKHWWKIFHR